MGMATVSLRDHTGAQLSSLCRAVGFPASEDESIRLLHELLGPVGARPVSQPPAWDSDVADDRTPAEFSVAFDEDGSATVRFLIEPVAAPPSHRANMELSTRLVHSLSERFGFSLDQFHAISELFLPAEPRGKFTLWFSLVLRPNGPPVFKLYFNPAVGGHRGEPQLVREGFDRLGFRAVYDTVIEHGGRRGPTSTGSPSSASICTSPCSRGSRSTSPTTRRTRRPSRGRRKPPPGPRPVSWRSSAG
jgi:DMATS type aromatic prenyltransferase